MSVFTTVKQTQLESFLNRYDIGGLRAFSPIAAGITNTNYSLDTDNGEFVLTLYEHHSDDELNYMLGLQRHLAGKSVLCPAPVEDRRGDLFSTLNQRPAAINTRLAGEVQRAPGAEHCAAIGTELARFHLAGADYAGLRLNPRGADWVLATGDMLEADLEQADRLLLAATLRDFLRLDYEALPSGAIHADLFHDNALFEGSRLCGIVDFDYACGDCFALDIAVLLHDWCIDSDGGFDAARVDALLDAYQEQRVLDEAELLALPVMLRFSALRFWLSRLYDRLFPLPGELTFSKDPDEFHRLLLARGDDEQELQQMFLSRLRKS
jgi:homoserine kinase type II